MNKHSPSDTMLCSASPPFGQVASCRWKRIPTVSRINATGAMVYVARECGLTSRPPGIALRRRIHRWRRTGQPGPASRGASASAVACGIGSGWPRRSPSYNAKHNQLACFVRAVVSADSLKSHSKENLALGCMWLCGGVPPCALRIFCCLLLLGGMCWGQARPAGERGGLFLVCFAFF